MRENSLNGQERALENKREGYIKRSRTSHYGLDGQKAEFLQYGAVLLVIYKQVTEKKEDAKCVRKRTSHSVSDVVPAKLSRS